MFYHALLLLIVLVVGCSDSNFADKSRSAKASQAREVDGKDRDDAAAAGPNISAEVEVDGGTIVIGDEVAVPEMIAGTYLIFCAEVPQVSNQVVCRLEKENEATKADVPDLTWDLRTREGDPLSSNEFKIRVMDQSSMWHAEIEFITDKEVIISAKSPQFNGGSVNKIAPYVRKAPSSSTVAKEILPSREEGNIGFAESFSNLGPSSALWSASNDGATLDFSAGTMKCSVPGGMTAGWGMTSKNSYDFTNGSIELDLLNVNAPVNAMQVYWGIRSSENQMIFYVEAGRFMASLSDSVLGGMAWGMRTYDQLIDRHLRIQHDANNKWFTFQTSTDGITWSSLDNFPFTWSVASVQFFVSCGSSEATTASSAEIDNLTFKRP